MSPPFDAAARRARRVGLVDRAAEVGAEFIEGLRERAIGAEASGVTPEVAGSFAVLARGLRFCVALAELVEAGGIGPGVAPRADPDWPPAVIWDEPPKAWDVRRLVRSEIAYSREGRERENLFRDLEAWIREEDDPAYWARPVRDIALGICNAMGVRPKCKTWTPEDRGGPPFEPVPYEEKHPRPMRDSYVARTPRPRPPWAVQG